MPMSTKRQAPDVSVGTIVIASLLAVSFGGVGLYLASRFLYLVLNIGLMYAVPALAVGVCLGRWSRRWGWLPALLATVLPTLELAYIAAPRYAALTPIAAIAGWLVGSYSRTHGRRWLLATAVPLAGIVVAATLMEGSDGDWLVREATRIARYLGGSFAAQGPQVYQVYITDLKLMASPASIGGSVTLRSPEPERLAQETFRLFVYGPGARRHVIHDASALLWIRYPQSPPRSASAAADLATELGVPKRFLEGLHHVNAPPRREWGPQQDWAPPPPSFEAGPVPGTWQHPRVEIYHDRVVVEVGTHPS